MTACVAARHRHHIFAARRRKELSWHTLVSSRCDNHNTALGDGVDCVLHGGRTGFEQSEREVDNIGRIVVPNLFSKLIKLRDGARRPADRIIDIGKLAAAFAERANWNDLHVPSPARDAIRIIGRPRADNPGHMGSMIRIGEDVALRTDIARIIRVRVAAIAIIRDIYVGNHIPTLSNIRRTDNIRMVHLQASIDNRHHDFR
mmetsp:Transcript_10576/g.13499  ORF Transcript_10576/g.13499 Transcript_10576/m.13499 type:complete len:202 (-) Transcript_10576:193-798(-)